MATVSEIKGLYNNSNFQDAVEVEAVQAALDIIDEDGGTANHANRLIWAKITLSRPRETMQNILPAIIVQNRGLTVAQIQGASSAAILSAVNAVINVFADGGV